MEYNRNFNGTQINGSSTISEVAGADMADCRNRIMKYDENGNVVLAAGGSDIPVGIALIEAGINDISGKESGKVAAGDDVDIQVKDIGYVLAGGEIGKGCEITAGADGVAMAAEAGDYVVGIALTAVLAAGEYCRVQISRYQKGTVKEEGGTD